MEMALGSRGLAVAGAVLILDLCAAVQSPDKPAPTPESGLKQYAPGLKIDWSNRRVEIESKVILRKGPLELLACSPQTREHESILVIRPKPLQVYEALGLIGLTPGAPVRYDEAEDRWLPPSGDAVTIHLHYRDDRGAHEVPAAQWLRTTKEEKPPLDMTWVFAGSRKLPDGRFVADLDGTVICLVDFDSALIAVGALHSADNEVLWLEANTEEIPPLETPCTIVIGPAKRPADKGVPAKDRAVEEKAKPGDNPPPDGSNQH
jgi:hypothetical protein